MSKKSLIATLAAAAATSIGPASVAHAAYRPCTAGDLAGGRAPAQLRDAGLDRQDGPLLVGTRYRVVVVQELAIGDHAEAVDGSIAVTAPNGPPLQPGTADDRPVYDFTPTSAGPVRLVVDWDDRIGGSSSSDYCHASQTFDIPAVVPALATTLGSFSSGARTLESFFRLKLRAKEPQDQHPVTVILRARRNTTKPPPPRGRAVKRFTFKPRGDGHFESSAVSSNFGRTFGMDPELDKIQIYPYGNIAFGTTLRFGFSFEAIQNGRRVGGMRAGARCRRKQFFGHSAVKCRPVGLRQRP